MYARTKTFTNKDGSKRTYVQIVEAVREHGKVRQKVVANLGRIDELQKGSLDRLIASLAKFSKTKWIQAEADKLMVHSAREWGLDLIFRHLWEQLGLDFILKRHFSQAYTCSQLTEAVYAMVLNRISDPLSKRGVNEWLKEVYRPSFDHLELHHFYRALDFLAEYKERIELDLFDSTRNLFDLEVDMIFWDTTSTYFEGRGPEELGRYGHSKDHRPDRIQVMVGVVMTRAGIPIAHEVFPGNTADVNTFSQIIAGVRERFQLTRVVFVGDRGMVSQDILEHLDKNHIEYIVGMRMRKVKDVGEVLKTGGRYRTVKENLKVKEDWYDADRYIVCHNPVQAEHDKKAREEMCRKLEEQLKNGGIKSLVGNRGYRRYLLLNKDAVVGIDQEALKEEARYDGKYVLRTNSQLSTEEVALAYKDLWRVERAFREMKSSLDLRPVYHWKDSRVRGHIMVCFLALVLESALQRKLAEKEVELEYVYLLRDLQQLKAVELSIGEDKYLCRTELVGNAYEAFRALGIRPPLKVAEIKNDGDGTCKQSARTSDDYHTPSLL
ncbi:IS1634 family transposase [Desulfofundulus thermocisternus]|uniref:IS1634 family transposase n=1 Tax=Desulfofundulus thermocisternus TaxID=42471 RepID=UPI00217EE626|nr:IS1634 family transposase [Desulfofundulus thermocisternus]MCS5696466.1 IS1634 family transposase [Desulfofundulus thermocisternus]